MPRQAYINLAIKDLKKTMDFFRQLGFSYNPLFTDEKAACMIINDDCFVMLLEEPFFKTFLQKDLIDATKSTEVLMGISAESRKAVDELVDKALSLGATETRDAQDYGFMFVRAFNDLDGHICEVIWMDLEEFKRAKETNEFASPG